MSEIVAESHLGADSADGHKLMHAHLVNALELNQEEVYQLEFAMSDIFGAVDASMAVIEGVLNGKADPFLHASELIVKDAWSKTDAAVQTLFQARTSNTAINAAPLFQAIEVASNAIAGATAVLIENMDGDNRSLWCAALLLQRTSDDAEKLFAQARLSSQRPVESAMKERA